MYSVKERMDCVKTTVSNNFTVNQILGKRTAMFNMPSTKKTYPTNIKAYKKLSANHLDKSGNKLK